MVTSGLDPLRTKILGIFSQRGVSLRYASEVLGRNPAYMHQFIHKGTPPALKEADRAKLAELLSVPESELMTEEQKRVAEIIRRPTTAAPATKDLPILGYARGGSDVMTISDNSPLGMANRPAALEGVEDAYAVEVVGDSHAPRLNAGELAFVHPHRALARGCDCVVQLSDGSAMIGLFVKMDADRIAIEKINPAEKREWHRSEVKSVHRIVGADFAR